MALKRRTRKSTPTNRMGIDFAPSSLSQLKVLPALVLSYLWAQGRWHPYFRLEPEGG